jgi:hypothetical protein
MMSQSITPHVFVSAVSSDLASARKLANDALTQLECLPIEQSNLGTEYGPVRDMLGRKITSCQAVIHLVGRDFGGEPDPATIPTGHPRRFWTQIEHDLALQLGKKLYVIICDKAYPFDVPAKPEGEANAALETEHRESVFAGTQFAISTTCASACCS